MDDFYTPSTKGAARGGMLRLQLPLCDKTVTSEVAGDFSLPDYQPEIKRLLRVSATVQPPSHYVGGGSAEFSGTVDFCMIYAGSDGKMYCFPTSSDYVFRVPLEAGADFDLNDGLICYAMCEPEAVISRVSGPRRMNVKCRLKARVRAYASYLLEEKRRGASGTECGEERLWQQAETAVSAYAQGEPFMVSDEILLDRESGQSDDWRIVSGDAQVMINEALCGNGRINCRGEVVLKLMLQQEGEGQDPVIVWRKLPFNHEMSADSAMIGGEAVVNGYCTELNLSMQEGRVLCEVEVVPEAHCQRGETLTYTADWYATGCESSCGFEQVLLPRALRCINGNVTQSESKPIEDWGIGNDMRVVDVAGQASMDTVTWDRGRYVISGACRYTLILATPDNEMTVKDIELPWRYVVDGAPAEEMTLQYEGRAQVLSARARMDGKRLAIDAELGVCARLWTQQEIRVVTSMAIGERLERSAGEMILCYPSREDTLWSVGKKYGCAIDRLVVKNRLNDEKRADDRASLSDVRVMGI
ncbi:MAG: DUF3794 domain-containing protein [Clostridia bacterium]|nr:DUF3794 domain-containing protein [Clostridia bacterium]